MIGSSCRRRQQRGGLAGAVRTEQGDHLALVDVQVEVADDGDAVVAGGHVARSSSSVRVSRLAAVLAPTEPRYASITVGSRLISAGVPSAILRPNSIT